MGSLTDVPPHDSATALRTSTRRSAPARRRAARAAFYAHLWAGVIFTAALLVVGITGIALNHKGSLGLMPDVPHEPSAAFAASIALDSLAQTALQAVPMPPSERTLAHIDRMDVRPRDGYVKVRMRDATSTEVTLDVATGRVLHVGARGDVFLEKLHSGEIFGDGWILLSDAAAVALIVTLISGYWLWLAPRLRRAPGAAEETLQ